MSVRGQLSEQKASLLDNIGRSDLALPAVEVRSLTFTFNELRRGAL
jgi:hypothetical protein